MAKKPVKYFVVDAFTESAFKGNPAAVCLLEEEKEDSWMQGVATEFNLSETCYLTPIAESERSDISLNRFRLRWFTPATEVELCGHATLASAHVLFSSGLVKSDIIEFVTLSGVLTAKKVSGINDGEGASEDGLFIELEFPADTVTEFNSADISQISAALNDAPIIDIKRTTVGDHLLVELASGKDVVELQPDIGAIAKCPGGGILVSGTAPPESGFDYYCRTFFPKVGINEDPITGSAQCALAPYWAKKMGKWDLSVYAASPRGGVVHVHFDDQSKRILMRGKAVTVMNGCVMI
ncbi:putative isomerase BH0283 isoform A [Glycine soja]|nr:putative isomerase BH0283 isoform A [Glycine soja]